MKINVIKNAKRNIISGVIFKAVVLLLPFVERTIIRYYLGSLYLGLNSLFSSILSVLSIAELGFGGAIVYNMYKPIAENNVKRVNVFLAFYKNTYRVIGGVVLAIGLVLVPFLPYLIKDSYPEDINITLVYLIFLSNSVISYFLSAYLSSLLVAHQRDDVQNNIATVVSLGMYLIKFLILILLRSYYLSIIIIPFFTIIQNLVVAFYVKKMFPQYKCEGHLEKEDKSAIQKLVAGTFITKACSVTRNSLDNICTSAFLGLSLTAIYSNYYQVSHSITIILGIIASSFIGGIGNHVVTKSIKENFEELELLDFVYMLISGWCMICLLCLYQPFMQLWMGEEMMLPMTSVVLLCVYFYALKIGDIRAMYANTNGMWWHHRYRAIVETVMNLMLNVLLGKIWGVNGIILATVISLFFCNTLWATSITFGLYFKDKKYIKAYYLYQIKYAVITGLVCGATFACCSIIHLKSTPLTLIIRAGICVVFPVLLYVLSYRRNPLFIRAIKKFTKRNKPILSERK